MKKLSRFQAEVVELMKQGWELGHDRFSGMTWLQQGGCGYGGATRMVNKNTRNSLLKREIISVNKVGYPTTTYTLTDQP